MQQGGVLPIDTCGYHLQFVSRSIHAMLQIKCSICSYSKALVFQAKVAVSKVNDRWFQKKNKQWRLFRRVNRLPSICGCNCVEKHSRPVLESIGSQFTWTKVWGSKTQHFLVGSDSRRHQNPKGWQPQRPPKNKPIHTPLYEFMMLTFRSLETQPWGKYGNMFPKTLQSLGEPELNICIVLSSGSIVFRTAQTKNCLLFQCYVLYGFCVGMEILCALCWVKCGMNRRRMLTKFITQKKYNSEKNDNAKFQSHDMSKKMLHEHNANGTLWNTSMDPERVKSALNGTSHWHLGVFACSHMRTNMPFTMKKRQLQKLWYRNAGRRWLVLEWSIVVRKGMPSILAGDG